MSETAGLLSRYFRQQQELGMPAYVFSAAVQTHDVIAVMGSGPTILGRTPAEPVPVKLPANMAKVNEPVRYEVPAASPAPVPRVEEPPARQADVRPAMVELYRTSRACAKCARSVTKRSLVFGSGNVNAPLMVIGETPGLEEDQQGLPFVGPAGQLLTKMLAAVNIDRAKDAFITDLIKCRSPKDQEPQPTEVAACVTMLKRQIDIMHPRALLLLGKAPAQALLGRNDAIGQWRTKTHEYQGIPTVVTYHPASLLRNESLKRGAWEDLQRLRNILQEMHAYAAST